MLNLVVASGYASIAYIFYNSGDYQGAIENYSQAISLNPDDYISYFSRGIAHLMTKNYENAIADLTETIRLNPHYGEAYAERGVARAAVGDHQNAIEDCNRGIQLNPQYVRSYFGRGAARFYSGNYPGALEDFSMVASLEPSATADYNLGIYYYSQGTNSQAIKYLTQALYVNHNFIAAYYVRGNACYDLGDERGAFADFKEAKQIETAVAEKIDFDDEFALYARGLAYYRLGNPEIAIADLQSSAKVALQHQNMAFHQKVVDLTRDIQS
ncbi:hypothetical protein CLI64_07760 [Nostoc sp. CENA543]|uniref:tetratricopeptide repeat protein n=1 Tax=Nostoc sp. CENA543 TaxID=1869241 RepID=UPI000CA27FEE|nr:tetratricopeptide repeat protein [Nostoc sp. CENA543]AUT00287.1 hypothetical protein CLI64_07760 [Nostoc sp. CENA543]